MRNRELLRPSRAKLASTTTELLFSVTTAVVIIKLEAPEHGL
jgi:hypothetical protein